MLTTTVMYDDIVAFSAVLHGLLPSNVVGSYSLDTHRHFIGAVLKIQICMATRRHFIGATICDIYGIRCCNPI